MSRMNMTELAVAMRTLGLAFRYVHDTLERGLVEVGFLSPKTGTVHLTPSADIRRDIMRQCAGNRRRQMRRR
jgi:hypothetical protein